MPDPEKETEKDTPKPGKLAFLKDIAALLMAVAALVTAVAAMRKDNAATRSTYEQLASDVRELSKQTERNHDDIVAIRTYLEGYMQGLNRTSFSAPIGSAALPLVEPTHTVHPIVEVSSDLPMPPPPRVSAPMKRIDPPSYDRVVKE